jgi:formylglycine-generating enzyme required for sulfatase activity
MIGTNPSHFQGGPDLPVENVSWDDICGKDGFLERLNAITEGVRPEGLVFRLPSEAEWEYACHAETTSANVHRPFPSQLMRQGWFRENAWKQTHSVGQKSPNAWGLHDLYGNVWEWCQDVSHADWQGTPKDGAAWVTGGDPGRRVLLGGSWAFPASLAHSNCRYGDRTDVRSDSNGFRPVMGAPHGDGDGRS